MKQKIRLFLPCYFSFFSNGAMALLMGTILPYLMEEAQINYSAAGGVLSVFAIGNLVASFINPVLANKIGRKATILITSVWIPICFLTLSFVPSLWIIYFVVFMCGVARGSCSILNNAVVNDNSNGNPAALNFLHMVFAFGAFSAPFMTTVYIGAGFTWRAIVYTIVILSTLSTIGFATMKLDYNWPMQKPSRQKDKKTDGQEQPDAMETGKQAREREYAFLRQPDFYIMGLLLFFYLGFENCVNGWFVTYFRNIGIMSDAYATNLVSITWVMVLLGRFMSAKVSGKVNKNKWILLNCLAVGFFFFLLIATKNIGVITVAIAGLGFFFAGIYPTGVSCGGQYIKGSTTGMSMLLAMAALGGIITPKLVGMAADSFGMVSAILLLCINMAGMVLLAVFNLIRQGKLKNEIVK